MWKKAFAVLLSLNLLIIAGVAIWFVSLPKAGSSTIPPKVAAGEKQASFQVSIGDKAINTYLEYALSQQADLKGVLSYASVHFNNQWNVQLGAELEGHVVPFDAVFTPQIVGGNLHLHMESAQFGGLPVPTSALFLVLQHLPWPNWIHTDGTNQTLDVNLTERPQHPYGVKILNYSDKTKLLTLLVSIEPKSAFPKGSTTKASTGA